MKKIFTLVLFSFLSQHLLADRIYIMNTMGYDGCEPQLAAAIAANGHTVVTNTNTTPMIPGGFVSTCVDPVNGYDWYCCFGLADFTPLAAGLKNFIDQGGKVFYQYEVTCCTSSSTSVASLLASFTGWPVTPNANGYLSFAGGQPGWEASAVSCCATFTGAAYKGLDGLPVANQLQATADLNGGSPSFVNCPNFGFRVTTTDFTGTAHKGAMVGLGDVNLWYDGDEPFNNGGTTPVNMSIINFIFPNDTSTCKLLPAGCIDTFINQSNVFNLNLGNDTTLCPGSSFVLNATTAGATYLWQNGSSLPTFTVNGPGTYWVQVTVNNCTASDTIHVLPGVATAFNLGPDTTLCNGAQLVLQPAVTGTYLWQNGSVANSFTVTATGTYWVQVTTACGVVSDTIHVNVVNTVLVNLGNDTLLCPGSTMVLNAGNPGASYLWQNASTAQTFTVNTAGTYWVKVTQTGCIGTDTIHVQYYNTSTLNLGNDTTVCGAVSMVLQSGIPGATYLWQNGSGLSTLNVNSPGTYWVQVTTACGVLSDTLVISSVTPFTVNLGNDTTICQGASLVLNAGTGTYTYLWQNGSTASGFTVNTAGTYWVEKRNGPCKASDTIQVNYYPVASLNLGADTLICAGAQFQLNATQPNATYVWQDLSTGSTYWVTGPGTYWVSVTTPCGVLKDTIVVDQLALPTLHIGNDTALCIGDAITLNATAAWALWYVWNDNSTAPVLTASAAGLYWVQVGSVCGPVSDSLIITNLPEPTVNLGPDREICPGDSLWLNAFQPGASYVWQDGSPKADYLVKNTGWYWVQLTQNSCQAVDSVWVGAGTDCQCQVFIPNAFSPNNDGVNDEFRLIHPVDLQVDDFLIFDRWGELVFRAQSLEDSWNGHLKGGDAENGTYFYLLRYTCQSSGKQFVQKGDLTLLR